MNSDIHICGMTLNKGQRREESKNTRSLNKSLVLNVWSTPPLSEL